MTRLFSKFSFVCIFFSLIANEGEEFLSAHSFFLLFFFSVKMNLKAEFRS